MGMDTAPKRASLLGIAPELRNQIYHDVAAEPGAVAIHHYDLVPHALARVSRQTQYEFLPVFQASTAREVNTVRVHVKNFDFRGMYSHLKKMKEPQVGQGDIESLLANLSLDRKTDLTMSIALNGVQKMRKHSLEHTEWRAHLEPEQMFGHFKCKYEVCVDYEALGRAGVNLAARLLVKLCVPSHRSSLCVVSSLSSLEKLLVGHLGRYGIRSDGWEARVRVEESGADLHGSSGTSHADSTRGMERKVYGTPSAVRTRSGREYRLLRS